MKIHRNVQVAIVTIAVLAGGGCGKQQEQGILGIVVPIGDGKVSDTTPYVISAVVEDSPAHAAGVKPDDVIVQINQVPIEKGMEFGSIYREQLTGKPGEKVTLVIRRGDKQMVFEIVRARKE